MQKYSEVGCGEQMAVGHFFVEICSLAWSGPTLWPFPSMPSLGVCRCDAWARLSQVTERHSEPNQKAL